MGLFKTPNDARKTPGILPVSKVEGLRAKRIAQEQEKKAAGVWGEMSVGAITRGDKVFFHYWKGNVPGKLSEMALKKPREMTEEEHAALVAWLRSGQFEGFTQSFVAWDVTAAEAERIMLEQIAKQRDEGKTVINPSPQPAAKSE